MAFAASSASALSIGLVWNGEYAKAESEMEQVQRSGATVFRLPIDKSVSEATYESIFTHAWEHGITIEPYLVRSNGSATQFPTSGEYASWDSWVKGIVKRYGYSGSFWSGKSNPKPVPAWEVWNEENLAKNNPGGSSVQPENYARFLITTSEAIKSAQKEQSGGGTTVLFGGLYMPAGEYYNSFLEKAANVGGEPSSYNGVAIHPYAFENGATQMSERVNDVRYALNNHVSGGSGKSLWITELGWPVGGSGAPSVSPEQQASLLTQSLNWIKGAAATDNIQVVDWYNIRDYGGQITWSYFCGMRDANGNYRPSWWAFEEETGAAPWPAKPTVSTESATGITEYQATLNGWVNPNGTATSYHFEYGRTQSYGASRPVPDGNAGSGSSDETKSVTVENLEPHVKYHYRLVATSEGGTSYGQDRTFTTDLKWSLRNTNSPGAPDVSFWFGRPGATPVTGDWNGDGTATAGTYDPASGVWKLRNQNTAGSAEIEFQYGGGPWTTPVVGDWDGNGTTTIGLYNPSTGEWRLRNYNSAGSAEIEFQYGGGTWQAVTGDWDGTERRRSASMDLVMASGLCATATAAAAPTWNSSTAAVPGGLS